MYPRGSAAHIWSDNRLSTLEMLADIVDQKRARMLRKYKADKEALDEARKKLTVKGLPDHALHPKHLDSFRFA